MSEINVRQIEVFLTVAKHQNISKAAKELFISQPSLSKWISKMEEDYGTPLFTRTNRGVILTKEGAELYANLDYEYQRFRVNVEKVYRQTKEYASFLKMGCLNRKECHRHGHFLSDKLEKEKGVHIVLERFSFRELIMKLLREELDMIISLSTDIEKVEEFDSRDLGPLPLYFITSKDVKCQDELNGKTLILENPEEKVFADAICRHYNIKPDKIKYVSSYTMLTTLVARGDGFAIDGEMDDFEKVYEDLSLIPIDEDLNPHISCAWLKSKKQEI